MVILCIKGGDGKNHQNLSTPPVIYLIPLTTYYQIRKMKKQTLLSIAISVLVSGINTVPAMAEQTVPYDLQTQEQLNVIPQSSALVVTFPQPVQLDAGQNNSLPMTLLLAQPIVDAVGRELVPSNSPIAVKLISSGENIRIVAESIVIGGQVVPIQATSSIIPSTRKTVVSGNEQARRNSPVGSRFGSSLVGAIGGGDNDSIITGGLAGNAVGIFVGMVSPKKVPVVSISQGSAYILKLETPVTLPQGLNALNP